MSKKLSFAISASIIFKVLFLILSTSFILQSCSKQNIEEILSISGKVTSAITGEPIDSIEVNYYTLEKEHVVRTYTDSTGMYHFEFTIPWKGILDFHDKDSIRAIHYSSIDTTITISLETKKAVMNVVMDTL